MTRLCRILFNLLAVISTVLCIGVIVLWYRGYHKEDSFGASRLTGASTIENVGAITCEGAIWVSSSTHWGWQSDDTPAYRAALLQHMGGKGWQVSYGVYPIASPPPRFRHETRWLGVRAVKQKHGTAESGAYITHVVIPTWEVVTLFAVLPFTWPLVWGWRLRRRQRRKGDNLCIKCGYDLRASAERCPECGTARIEASP